MFAENIMNSVLLDGKLMDKSFPSILSDNFALKDNPKNNSSKTLEKYRHILFAIFNHYSYIEFVISDFFIKGMQNNFFQISKKEQIFEFLDSLYHCYNIIIRIYESVSFKNIQVLYDDITHTRLDQNTKEIEILIFNQDLFLYDNSDLFLSSKKSPAHFTSSKIKPFSEKKFEKYLKSQGALETLDFENLMFYSKIKYGSLSISKICNPKKNILFLYSNTSFYATTISTGQINLATKTVSFRVLDRWLCKHDSEVGCNIDNQGCTYVFTYFDRCEKEFKFAVFNPENNHYFDKYIFLLSETQSNKIKCQFREEKIDLNTAVIGEDDEENDEILDECFCPNIYFPKAKSSRGTPINKVPFRTLLERIGYSDKPILERLDYAAELSISFYDIETLAKPISSDIHLAEAKLFKFDSCKYSNYIHSIQEAVCIGYQSFCPELSIWQQVWEKTKFDAEHIEKENFLSILESDKHDDIIQKNKSHTTRFANLIKNTIHNLKTDTSALLNQCHVFELGNNAISSISKYTEPNSTSIYQMVSNWLDLAFEQAKLLKFFKEILLSSIILNLKSKTSNMKRGGDLSKILRYLLDLTRNHYVFG